MATAFKRNPMDENEFYKKLANIDNYIKPVLGSSETNTKATKEPTIFDAIKAGLVVPAQKFVEKSGPEILRQRDDKGHTAVHWACLGGHVQMLKYLIEQGVPVNEPSDAEPQPRPIHWACTNGHISVVDVLLQQGVSIDSVDSKGCTPLIVAAQYGKTMLAGYLMGKGARLQLTDKDGDNALHWASFKGHEELMRLLIYSGFSIKQRDDYGQTALHLACINGSLSAVRALCERDGIELDLKDKNGKTPYLLAAGRKHDKVMTYLKKKIDKNHSILGKVELKTLIFGPPGNSKYPIIFFISVLLFWAYPIYILKCLYNTWEELWIAHITFWVSNVLMWISLYHANTIDPGYLPRNIPEYDMAIKQVAHFNDWKEGDNPLSRLCHTCRTIKPLRSKHCRVCGRCVQNFDHHCPWIYNCVGYRNRKWFYGFILFVSFDFVVAMRFLHHIYLTEGATIIIYISIPISLYALLMTVGLLLATTIQMFTNITTNENLNWTRYKYLQDSNGKYKNPFNRGIVKNVLEYFYFIPPYTLESLHSVRVA